MSLSPRILVSLATYNEKDNVRPLVEEILRTLTAENLPVATALAAVPQRISGFGHVKERNLREAAAEQAKLLARYRQPALAMAAE